MNLKGMKMMKIHPDDLCSLFPSEVQWIPDNINSTNGFFLQREKGSFTVESLGPFVLRGAALWMSLAREGPYWMEPFFGSAREAVPKETQLLLWKLSDSQYGVFLPLVSEDYRFTLESDDRGIRLAISGDLTSGIADPMLLSYIGCGSNYYQLVEDAMQLAAIRLKTFRLRKEKNEPAFLNGLGWCTWDAFYHDVDEEKVLKGLDSFSRGGVRPKFLILDDGAWDTEGDMLNDFAIQAAKFPSGLSKLVEKVKQCYGIEWFGIWHAFQGYWAGINPEGNLGRKYRWLHNRAIIRPWEAKEEDVYLIESEEACRFFNDLYRFLSKAGINLVKVDGQSALELFTDSKCNSNVSIMKTFQEAMQGSAQHHFGGNLIHSMCHGSDIPFNMKSSTVWRNSQDYFPEKGFDAQQKHIFINAMNNIWSSTFAIPDWDMFQTHQESSYFHAAARSISGGPIYVCDKPEKQNFDILNMLTISDGVVLRCDRPALPTSDCLFINCYEEPHLLKIANRVGDIGIIGLFHCYKGGGELSGSFLPSEVPELEGQQFAVYFNRESNLVVADADTVLQVVLSTMMFELISLTPIRQRFAPIGLLDKFNNAASIVKWVSLGNKHEVQLKDGGGSVGMYCKEEPTSVQINGCLSDYSYNSVNGLMTVSAPKGDPIVVEVTLPTRI
jgi:raffinose synthase